MTLAYIIEHAQNFPWNFALYLPRNSEWTRDTPATVLDPNDCADDEEDPPLAMANDLRCALSIQEIQSVVENARQQLSRPGGDELFRAFKYYFDHDAFIKFDR